ncbi:MAG: MFS transporter [Puia sp.]
MKKQAAIGFIFITLLIDVIGWGLIIPVMPQLIAGLKHIPINQASIPGSWLLFMYAFMQFFCAPILGSLSDQYGRRPVLLFALFWVRCGLYISGICADFWMAFSGEDHFWHYGCKFFNGISLYS